MDFSPADQRALVQICSRLEAGSSECHDVSDLFLRLRTYLPDGHPVKEVANFLAHSKRDRGITFQRIEEYIDNVITVMAAQQGIITWSSPVFTWAGLTDATMHCLEGVKGGLRADDLDGALRSCIPKLLDNRSLAIKDKRVTSCELVVDETEGQRIQYIAFKVSGVPKISAQMTWRVPLFD
jgi:hypothetical protein